MQNRSISRFIIGFGLALATILLACSTSSAAVILPGNQKLEKVDFERHVMGLFGRQGCNSGSCHGSFQGKGGFRLSLFGYEAQMDFNNLTRELSGRRINIGKPHESLMLMKATGDLNHGGAVRFAADSWQYQVLATWMSQGAKWTPGSGEVEKIQIVPPEHAFKGAGEKVKIKVMATFKDGTEEDVTFFSDYRTNDDAVADVNKNGEISSIGPGVTPIIVTYRSHVLPVRVLVPTDLPKDFVYPKVPTANYIDEIVFAQLKKLNMVPSELSSDTEFIRRVYIDTIGRLPSSQEVRDFLKDKNQNKRAKLIDKLLDDPMHAALWATKLSDITNNDTVGLEQPQNLKPKRSQMWHEWFKKRLHENMPYDQIVKGVLTATSRDGKEAQEWAKEEFEIIDKATKGFDFADYAKKPSLDLYWRKQQKVAIEQWGEKTAAAFMGIRLECAQCHKHPFDRWAQEEYRAYANIFAQVNFGISNETKQAITDFNKKLTPKDAKNKNQVPQLKEVYLLPKPGKLLTHPDTDATLKPKALGGPEFDIKTGVDLRANLFEWLRQPDNPYFARSFVNRIWGHYLGIGIVNPVDDFSMANPPSNDKLLNALAQDFIKHKFDIRAIEKAILNSRAYQLTSKTNDTNKFDKNNYSHAYVRPMMAEVVLDVINSALDTTENFGKDVKPGIRAIELGPSFVQSPAFNVLKLWGRPPRQAACDCERSMDPGLPNKLYMMTDPALLQKVNSPQGRLQTLLKNKALNDQQVLEELFLSTLSRFPTQAEQQAFAKYHQEVSNRQTAFNDVLWALLNTKEFIFNH